MTEVQESLTPKRRPRRNGRWRWLWAIPALPVVLVLLAVGLLYVPGVLNRVASWVLPEVEKASGLHIEAADISLRFPMTLGLEDALVLTERGDTMVSLGRGDVALNPAALLIGNLGIRNAEVRNVFYQMGAPDSLYIGARVDSVGAAATIPFSFSSIKVAHADLNGARVLLLMGNDTTESKTDSVRSAPLLITSGPISLRNVDYRMAMASTSDTIAAYVSEAILSDGRLLVADTIEINAGVLTMDLPRGLYGKRGATPLPGLDLNWLAISGAKARVDSFAMRGTAMTVPVKALSLTERCGLTLSASGVFSMDSTALRADGFKIRTNRSTMEVTAMMGLDSVAERTPVSVSASASLMPADATLAMPALLPVLAPLPADLPLSLSVDASGTMAALKIDTVAAAMERIFAMRGSGTVDGFSDPKTMRADVSLAGSMVNPGPVNKLLHTTPDGFRLPPLTLRAHAKANGGAYSATATATTGSGRLALKGSMAGSAPAYNAALRLDSFPVSAFMPSLGIHTVSGALHASGRGFNPMARGARMNADANIASIIYNGHRLGGLTLTAALDSALLRASVNSTMVPANAAIDLKSHLRPELIDWDMTADIRRLDLHALGMTDSVMNTSMAIASTGMMIPGTDSIKARADIRNLRLAFGSTNLETDSLGVTLDAGKLMTDARLGSPGLDLAFNAGMPLAQLGSAFGNAATMASEMVSRRELYADSLAAVLPPFALNLSAGPKNLINDYLAPRALSFGSLNLTAGCDSTISANARILDLRSGSSLKIDTITALIHQTGRLLALDIDMDNRPGTFDEFAHVCLEGTWDRSYGTFNLRQSNIQGRTGYMLGFGVETADSVISLSFNPLDPVIAYKNWKINAGNYLSLNTSDMRIRANLKAEGDDSSLQLYSQPRASTDSLGGGAEMDDLMLRIDNVHLSDWLSINPFAPPIAGDASAYVKLRAGSGTLNGIGTLSLENLTYGKQRVGDFDLDLDVSTNRSGVINAEVSMDVDGTQVLTASGAMNDTTRTDPFLVDLALTGLPLNVANPFLPKNYARLSGALNGQMKVTGKLNSPILNGTLRFADARVDVGMIGSGFTFDSIDVPVDSNVVRFDRFAIRGSNKNPLLIDGAVDMHNFASPLIDLSLNADNMQIINSKKAKNVNVYGKAFIDLDAKVRGSLRFLNVSANLALLPQTNVTYMVESAGSSAIGLQNDNDMVRFVNFADTAATVKADTIAPPSMMMALNALVNIQQGSTITVDLSADGQNRAQIKGDGILDFTMSPAQPDGRLTGRFTINSGFFRYSLPVISEKNFSFNAGSYVAFNGPIMNPTLNIHATDDIKANVTRSGENSRLVIFDVMLAVTGSLERMDVAFDLATDDDITVQNELKSMSATQRANQAMNLLLYGVYTGQGTTGNANLSGNALYGFLTSQLNTWAANTIKGVDLSFGMDQYDRTRDGMTNTATQYSYQVSKSLFNDRFKIVVGGNYSTDANPEENLAQNLISDLSFEYMLNDAGSMYIRLFRHTGYESILEGEVTQTGVGFVMSRKINRLGDLFIFRKNRKK